MANRIVFIGVGGGRISVSSQVLGTGGFVIQLEGHQIHIDPGPGALTRCRTYGVDASSTDIVISTHGHIDHANDVNALIDAMTLGGLHKRGTLIATPDVIDGNENGAWLMPFYRKCLNRVITIRKGDTVQVDKIKFTATETRHDEECAIGLRIESDSLSIGYTSDTAYYPELASYFKGCHVLIANVLRPGNEVYKTHMSSSYAAKLAAEVKPELFIIQHFGAKMLRARPTYEARDIQVTTGIRTMAASDGMKIELASIHHP